MIEKEGLRGLDLLSFALIHGCTQKGDGCWHGGYDRLAQRIGGKQRGTIEAINRLVDDGKIVKFDATIDGKKVKAFRSALSADAENADAENAEETKIENNSLFPNIPEIIDNNIKNKNKNISLTKGVKKCEGKGKVFSDDVEKLYAIFPTKCPMRGASTGKGDKCKKKLQSLLTKRSVDELEYIIKRYVEENYNKHYLQNFYTFLGNLPDYSEPEQPKTDWRESKKYFNKADFDEHPDDYNQMEIDMKRHLLRQGFVKFENNQWVISK